MPLLEISVDGGEQTLRHIRSAVTGCYQVMRGTFDNCQNMVWHNPYGLTPQQVFDALGPEAGWLVQYSQQMAQWINTAVIALGKPEEAVASQKPDGLTLTVNPDDTVTLTPNP